MLPLQVQTVSETHSDHVRPGSHLCMIKSVVKSHPYISAASKHQPFGCESSSLSNYTLTTGYCTRLLMPKS